MTKRGELPKYSKPYSNVELTLVPPVTSIPNHQWQDSPPMTKSRPARYIPSLRPKRDGDLALHLSIPQPTWQKIIQVMNLPKSHVKWQMNTNDTNANLHSKQLPFGSKLGMSSFSLVEFGSVNVPTSWQWSFQEFVTSMDSDSRFLVRCLPYVALNDSTFCQKTYWLQQACQ